MYETTDNETYLAKGLDILNKTINSAFDHSSGFLYAYMNSFNSQWVSEYQVHQQLDFLFPLLDAMYMDNVIATPYFDLFNETFDKIVQKLFLYGFDVQNYVIHTFTPSGSVSQSSLYVTRQVMVSVLIQEMNSYSILIPGLIKDFFYSSLERYDLFFSDNFNGFFRSPDYVKFDPWVNWIVMKSI